MAVISQFPAGQLVGVDLQPLAQLRIRMDSLATRLGVDPERDVDDLGALSVVAVAVDEARYLLRSFDAAPMPATEIHCAEAGDPVQQLRTLLAIVDFRQDITHWWDGSTWHEDRLDPVA